MTLTRYFLANQHDIVDGQARGFSIETKQGSLELFLLRQHDNIYAYKNHCPHLGTPLNWQPDTFMSLDGTHIQCSTHGALFTTGNGHCIAGPCSGQNLTVLTLEQRDDDELWLTI